MRVRDLIEKLQEFDPTLYVGYCSDRDIRVFIPSRTDASSEKGSGPGLVVLVSQ